MKRLNLWGAAMATLLAGHAAYGADASWIAVSSLVNGTSQNCGGGQSDWQVDIKGDSLRWRSRNNFEFSADLKGLQPDGSGKVTTKDDKQRVFYVTFEPGTGPRPFTVSNSLNACAWKLMPKK